MKHERKASRQIVSLFTGCGGLDLGFEEHGFEPAVCVDSDYEACKTLRKNRPEWNVFEGKIENFSFDAKVSGVIGGPPCQGFSTAGKGNPGDARNNLWREYFRVVQAVSPDFIVLENVAGMMLKKNRHHLADLIRSFEGLGFTMRLGVLNAADFGTPQSRRRLIILGGRGFSIELPTPTVSRHTTVREAIEDLEDDRSAPNHTPNRHAPHVVKRWAALAEGESDPNYHRARLYADRPSTTIRAGGGYGPKGNHLAGFHPPIHYRFPRQLTVREAARLQGFPDRWIFDGSKTAQGRQVGNAVPPPMAAAIAAQVAAALSAQKSRRRPLREAVTPLVLTA